MPSQLFDALANRQRRRLLVALLEHVDDGDESLALDSPSIERTLDISRLELYHVHLPKLSDVGIVEWNRETDEIVAGPRFAEARQLLELAHGRQTGTSAN